MECRVSISERGAIVLGRRIAVDGHSRGCRVRIVTHMHQDHMVDLERSIAEASFVAATPLTLDALEVLGYRVPASKRLDMEYGVKTKLCGDVVELRKANHVPGAAQVVVETEEGFRAGYTGDFKLPGTEPLRDLDVLVIDATYGYEGYVRPWQEEIDQLLADAVRDGLIHGPVALYAYNGKMEEVMLILRRYGVDAPFIVSRRVYRLVKVLERHGYQVGCVYAGDTKSAREAMRDSYYVLFRHFSTWRRTGCGPRCTHILLTGWEFRDAIVRLNEREWVVSFSDHADFRQLVSYVEEARPRRLVVDAYRGGRAARYFARYVSKRLGIEAVALPEG